MGCLCSTETNGLDAKTLARYHEQALKRWQQRVESAQREQQEIQNREREMLKIQQEQQQQQQQQQRKQKQPQEHTQGNYAMRNASLSEFVPAPFTAMGSHRTTTPSSDDSFTRRNTESIGFLPVMQQQQQLRADSRTGPRQSASGTDFAPFNTIFEESSRRRDTESVGFIPVAQLQALRNPPPQQHQQQQQQQQQPGLATFSQHGHRPDSRCSSTSSAGSGSGSRVTVPKSLVENFNNNNRPGSPLVLNRNSQVLHRGHIAALNPTAAGGSGVGPQPSSVLLTDSHDAIHEDFIRSVLHAKNSMEEDPRPSLNEDGDDEDDGDGTLMEAAAESPRNDRANPLVA